MLKPKRTWLQFFGECLLGILSGIGEIAESLGEVDWGDSDFGDFGD